MIAKQISRSFLVVVFSISVHCNSWSQDAFVVFGNPSSTGCSSTGICEISSSSFSLPMTVPISKGTPDSQATYVYITSQMTTSVTCTVAFAINLTELQINQLPQFNIFTSGTSGTQGNYTFQDDVDIPTYLLQGPVYKNNPYGFVTIPTGTSFSFTFPPSQLPTTPFFLQLSAPSSSFIITPSFKKAAGMTLPNPVKHKKNKKRSKSVSE